MYCQCCFRYIRVDMAALKRKYALQFTVQWLALLPSHQWPCGLPPARAEQVCGPWAAGQHAPLLLPACAPAKLHGTAKGC